MTPLTIGWKERVDFPDWGIKRLRVKMDTGARTSALDAQNGLAVTQLLRQLAKELGRTVVVVTHDNRIFHLGDRIVRIEDGMILPS